MQIGAYRIQRELGRGRMGVVYLAIDPQLHRQIAIKVLAPRYAAQPEMLARFENEAQLLASLNHPNIAAIHSLESTAAHRFLTMELVTGDTLAEIIRRGALPLTETCALSRQIAHALEAAHKQGVIHRDLKPSNIKVTPEGMVKVLDFGLATSAIAAAGAGAADSTSPTGTPGYMSPEQLRGEAVDHRADNWAFGCIVYECLTGRQPFAGETSGEIAAATLEREPDWEQLPVATPANLREMLTTSLDKQVERRLGSITIARREIEEAIAQHSYAAAAAPAAGDQATPNNLPLQLASFVGRETQRAEVRRLLGTTRLLTLTGAGGSGKTRLALEVAHDLLEEFPHGVWLVELAPLTDAELIPQSVATALGVNEIPDEPLTSTLVEHLADQRVLLILDNCEHLLTDCARLVDTLRRQQSELHILITSREALNLPGETIYRTPSLSVPPADASLTPAELRDNEAVRLFLERAAAVQTGFALTADNAPAIARICQRLDGIPLALELAAARVKLLPVDEIAARLSDRFRLLTGGDKTSLERHQTLRSLIDWSHDLLTEEEQTFFRRLSIHGGGWTLPAAERVTVGDGIERWQVLDLLAALTDKSLVEIDLQGGQATSRARYRMLETVREYAAARRREAGEDQRVRRLHRDYFVEFAVAAEPHLTGPEQGLWLSRVAAEHDNLRAALDACTDDDAGEEAAAMGLRLAGALGRYWFIRGHWHEGRRLCDLVLAVPGAAADTAERATVLTWAGTLAFYQVDYARARAHFEAALVINTEMDDRRGIAMNLINLGNLAESTGDYQEARTHYERSLELRRVIDDERGVAVALNNLGLLSFREQDLPRARSFYEESLAIRRRLGDQWGVTTTLHNLGEVACGLDDAELARTCHEESLSIRRQLGNQWGIALSLNGLGQVAELREDCHAARGYYQESLEILQRVGDRRGIGITLVSLAWIAHQCRDLPRAVRLIGASTALVEQTRTTLSPETDQRAADTLAAAAASMSTDEYESAWSRGHEMSLAASIEHALERVE